VARDFKETSAQNIDQKKYKENYDRIFGKMKTTKIGDDTVYQREARDGAELRSVATSFQERYSEQLKINKALEKDNAMLELMVNEASTRANDKQLEIIVLKARLHKLEKATIN